MCFLLHKISSSLYYKRLRLESFNACLHQKGKYNGPLRLEWCSALSFAPVCVCMCILNSYDLKLIRRWEMMRPRLPCSVLLHYLENLRRILSGFDTDIISIISCRFCLSYQLFLELKMGWHFLKELWKEFPTEEWKVKIAAQWSLCLMQLSMDSKLLMWISQIFLGKPWPQLWIFWQD